MSRTTILGPWNGPYPKDQDARQGIYLSQFRCGINMMRTDSLAIPLGMAIECRVSDGYVLAAVARTEFSARELSSARELQSEEQDSILPSICEEAAVLIEQRLTEVQKTPDKKRPYRGAYLARAYNQFDGYLVSSFGANVPKKVSRSQAARLGLKTSATREEVLALFPAVLEELSNHPWLHGGLVPLYVPLES